MMWVGWVEVSCRYDGGPRGYKISKTWAVTAHFPNILPYLAMILV